MKIAVTSTGPTLEHYVGSRANRCGYLLVIDSDTMEYEIIRNPATALSEPAAGKMVIQLMRENQIQAVLLGSCRSDLLGDLESNGIEVRVGISGSVRRAVERLKYSGRAVKAGAAV